MKIKHLFLASVAVLAGMASCSKDDGGKTADGEFDFYLRIDQTSNPLGRAEANQVADDTPVAFDEGALFFTDDNGEVIRYVRVTTSFGTGNVSPSELKAGYLFKAINNTATQVHVVGNVDFENINSLKNLSQLDNDAEFVKSLYDIKDDNFGVSNATLYGSDLLKPVTVSTPGYTEGADRYATILLKPLIARFEIEQISTEDVNQDFVLAGIYIDNFYYKSSVVGTYSEYNEIPYVHDVATSTFSYVEYDRNESYSNSEWLNIVFDDGGSLNAALATSTNDGTTYSVVPASKEAWAYNFYPKAQQVPYIILHLKDVKVWDNNASDYVLYDNQKTNVPGDAYLTVTGYIDLSTDGSVSLTGGRIYIIKDLAFTAGDLREEPKGPDPEDPDPNKSDVYVEVKLINWKTQEIGVEFN